MGHMSYFDGCWETPSELEDGGLPKRAPSEVVGSLPWAPSDLVEGLRDDAGYRGDGER